MYPDIDWSAEPDLQRLQHAFALMNSDFPTAISILEELAVIGSVAGMFYLGDAYATDRFHAKDLAKALEWYSKAEEHGWRPAPFMLGRIYHDQGRFGEAVAAFQRGAQKDHLPAIFWIGLMRLQGLGIVQDSTEGVRLLEVARSRGHLLAKRKLIGFYLSGQAGVWKFLRGTILGFSLAGDMIRLVVSGSWRTHDFEDRFL